MNRQVIFRRIKIFLIFLVLISAIIIVFSTDKDLVDDRFISFTVDTKKDNIDLFWKDDKGEILKTFDKLNAYLENKKKTLVFAMNAGMFKKDYSPQGLFIKNKVIINSLDTSSGKGNFYMKPNGVFFITTDNIAKICNSTDFVDNGQIKCATQSGPMLVINGQIHSAFNRNSTNLNIRNGVGILPNGNIILIMSKKEINLYDFAEYFQKMGCVNALYLDGFVSMIYYPEKKWIQTDGNFSVIIGITR